MLLERLVLLLKLDLFMRLKKIKHLCNRQSGVTLVELILSMIIISIAFTGVLTVMNLTVKHSADPVIRHQAVAIAQSYLEEILLQAYVNPTGGYSGIDRSQFDDVDDYNGLNDTGVKDHLGNSVGILSNYNVLIAVSTPILLSGSVAAKKVTVSVSGVDTSFNLVGYRANF